MKTDAAPEGEAGFTVMETILALFIAAIAFGAAAGILRGVSGASALAGAAAKGGAEILNFDRTLRNMAGAVCVPYWEKPFREKVPAPDAGNYGSLAVPWYRGKCGSFLILSLSGEKRLRVEIAEGTESRAPVPGEAADSIFPVTSPEGMEIESAALLQNADFRPGGIRLRWSWNGVKMETLLPFASFPFEGGSSGVSRDGGER